MNCSEQPSHRILPTAIASKKGFGLFVYSRREYAGQLSSYASEGAEYARYIQRVRSKMKINIVSRENSPCTCNVRKNIEAFKWVPEALVTAQLVDDSSRVVRRWLPDVTALRGCRGRVNCMSTSASTRQLNSRRRNLSAQRGARVMSLRPRVQRAAGRFRRRRGGALAAHRVACGVAGPRESHCRPL